jgi:hypothetical protein
VRERDGTQFGGDDDGGGDESFEFDTVILPARLDADVARRVAVAANRDGVSIADLLGRAPAAYDWSEPSAPNGERTTAR